MLTFAWMQSQLVMFGQNIVLLIGLLFCATVGLVLLVAGWTALKILIWQARRMHAEAEARRVKYDADGVELPPTFRGSCDHCGHVFDRVYSPPDGPQLCPRCYRLHKLARIHAEQQAIARPTPPADESNERGA